MGAWCWKQKWILECHNVENYGGKSSIIFLCSYHRLRSVIWRSNGMTHCLIIAGWWWRHTRHWCSVVRISCRLNIHRIVHHWLIHGVLLLLWMWLHYKCRLLLLSWVWWGWCWLICNLLKIYYKINNKITVKTCLFLTLFLCCFSVYWQTRPNCVTTSLKRSQLNAMSSFLRQAYFCPKFNVTDIKVSTSDKVVRKLGKFTPISCARSCRNSTIMRAESPLVWRLLTAVVIGPTHRRCLVVVFRDLRHRDYFSLFLEIITAIVNSILLTIVSMRLSYIIITGSYEPIDLLEAWQAFSS